MIRPSRALLVATTLTAVPICALAGVVPSLLPVCGLVLAAAAGLAAYDAVRAVRAMGKWSAAAPPQFRWFKDRAAEMPLTLRNGSGGSSDVRVHVALPSGIEAGEKTLLARVDAAGLLKVACTPRRRGDYELSGVDIEQASPWRLWLSSRRLPVESRIRVFPDLRGEGAADLIRARNFEGIHHRRQLGKGREFEKLREYAPGDSFEEIDWKATARRRHPVVKVFQIERTQEVYAIIDSSRLSARGEVLEKYVSAALTLGLVAESQHDKFGLAAFSAGVDRFVPAGSGARHFAACRDAIYSLQPRPVTPDLEEVFSFLRMRLRKRALLVFLTALDDPILAESFVRDIGVLARRHLVLANVPEQTEARPLFSGAMPDTPDQIYSRLAGHMDWTNLQTLRGKLQREGVRLTIVQPANLARRMAEQYADVRQRQLL